MLYKPSQEQSPAPAATTVGLPSLTKEVIALHASMPRDVVDGMVKDPSYIPEVRKDSYLQAWRDWARLNRRCDWPHFLHALALIKKLQESKHGES